MYKYNDANILPILMRFYLICSVVQEHKTAVGTVQEKKCFTLVANSAATNASLSRPSSQEEDLQHFQGSKACATTKFSANSDGNQ
ncbi:hypothetical protein Sjap_010019 [Stephania japonica]|uniref:Uncharacterized protein n=1 Tax=Stephania japonica TaxID=461633 RepID=A0AAP0P399_9MAGN